MKFLIGLMLITSSMAFAGTSDQDPTVASLRQIFKNAKTPTLAELRLGTTWVCRQYEARKDNFASHKPDNTFNFSLFGSIIYNHGKAAYTFTSEGTLVRPLEFKHEDKLYRGNIHVRRSHNGDLIVELAVGKEYMSVGSADAAIANNKYLAFVYGYCPANAAPLAPPPPPPSIEEVSAACDRAMVGDGDEFFSNDYYRGACVQTMAQPSLIDSCDKLNPGTARPGQLFSLSHENRVLNCIIRSQ